MNTQSADPAMSGGADPASAGRADPAHGATIAFAPGPEIRAQRVPRARRLALMRSPLDPLWSLILLAFAAYIAWHLQTVLSDSAPEMILITAVVLASALFGLVPGLLAALAGFFLLNYLFAAPRFSLFVTHPEDYLTLATFFLVAGLSGFLAGRLRNRSDAAESRAGVLAALSGLSEDLIRGRWGPGEDDEMLPAILPHLAKVTESPVVLIARGASPGLGGADEGAPVIRASVPADLLLSAADLHAADSALRRGRVEYAIERGWNGSDFTFLPLTAGPGPCSVLGYRRMAPGMRDLHYREEAIAVIHRQAELALERLDYAQTIAAERRRAEDSALRAALLASLSHDLRTPLATILGSVTTLRDLGATLPQAGQHDLLTAAVEEAERLSRYVSNLLQMTRLELGGPVRDAQVDPAEIAREAMARVARAYPDAAIATDLPSELPLIRAEAALLEQALTHLLENAARHGGGKIQLSAQVGPEGVMISVSDQGPGLPPALQHWLASPDLRSPPPGRGLGLAICKGIAQVLGGQLRASAQAGGGATLTLCLPLAAALPSQGRDD